MRWPRWRSLWRSIVDAVAPDRLSRRAIVGVVDDQVGRSVQQLDVRFELLPGGLREAVWPGGPNVAPTLANQDAVGYESIHLAAVAAKEHALRVLDEEGPQHLLFIFSESTKSLVHRRIDPDSIFAGAVPTRHPADDPNDRHKRREQKRNAQPCRVFLCKLRKTKGVEQALGSPEAAPGCHQHDRECGWLELLELVQRLDGIVATHPDQSSGGCSGRGIEVITQERPMTEPAQKPNRWNLLASLLFRGSADEQRRDAKLEGAIAILRAYSPIFDLAGSDDYLTPGTDLHRMALDHARDHTHVGHIARARLRDIAETLCRFRIASKPGRPFDRLSFDEWIAWHNEASDRIIALGVNILESIRSPKPFRTVEGEPPSQFVTIDSLRTQTPFRTKDGHLVSFGDRIYFGKRPSQHCFVIDAARALDPETREIVSLASEANPFFARRRRARSWLRAQRKAAEATRTGRSPLRPAVRAPVDPAPGPDGQVLFAAATEEGGPR